MSKCVRYAAHVISIGAAFVCIMLMRAVTTGGYSPLVLTLRIGLIGVLGSIFKLAFGWALENITKSIDLQKPGESGAKTMEELYERKYSLAVAKGVIEFIPIFSAFCLLGLSLLR